MATRTSITVLDDITGAEGAAMYRFSFGSKQYEIDLCDDGKALTKALAPFIAAGRRAGGIASVRAAPATFGPEKEHKAEVRSWAREMSGSTVATRGRISKAVYDAYDQAHR